MKAPTEAAFPEVRRPPCTIWIEPSLPDIERFLNDHIRGCRILSVDIETSGSRVTCIGFAPTHDLALVIPFDDDRRPGRSYWPTPEDERQAWEIVRGILEDPTIPKVFQNGLYDIAFLWRSYGIRTFGATHDTMLLHHALLPESLKSLGFMGSVYTDHGPWKSERKGVDQTIKRDA
jgi:DNA polymerase I-like protein with 3'-5' exonuclease and polymerase domains